MDKQQRAIDIIKNYYLAEEQNDLSDMIRSVCSYFDFMKNQELSSGDIDFLQDLSNSIGVPQYVKLLERDFSANYPDQREISLSTLASYYNEANLTRAGQILHRYQKNVLDMFVSGQNNRFILSAPTSFGKTFIVYEIIKKIRYKNVVLIFPTISLLSENFEKLLSGLSNTFNDYKVHTLSEDDEVAEKNIWIFTPERFLSFTDKHESQQFDFVFIDEIYKIDNEFIIDKETTGENERDVAYRVALSYACKKSNDLLLAGPYMNMANKTSFANFVKDNNFTVINYNNIEIVNKTITDIKGKKEYNIDGIQIELDENSKYSKVCDIAVRLTNSKENTIIYNNYKSGTERYAKEIISRLDQKEIHFESDDPIYRMFVEHLENTYSAEWIIVKALKYGIGIHHGLVPKYIQKEIINLFNRGILLYLISTTTITEGVNTSAKNIIITSNKKGRKNLKPFDAKNIAGRAGRFLQHFSGRVIIIDNNFEEVLTSNEDELQHKNYDVDSKKTDVDYTITSDKYLSKDDSEKKDKIFEEVRKRDIPREIIEQYKTVSISDKIIIYDRMQILTPMQLTEIKALISRLNYNMQISWNGFQEIINILKPIIRDAKLFELANATCRDSDFSLITAKVHFYLKGGFFGLLQYNTKGTRYDDAMRNTADMVYNVFKYQLVKYLGVFNLIYQHVMAHKEGVSIDEVSGITTLLQKLEYNAFRSKALILSDYGVPFKLVDYYDDPNGRKHFDFYEQYIDNKVSHIIQ
ncbi:MAG: DEAD/DEAH box helicase [Ruminococcaceae bacterium]|nr:DEAD/DEAH box helicase [Oscillospiraceae bacterium]